MSLEGSINEEEEESDIKIEEEPEIHLFSFSKLNKYFIFPFILPILCMLINFVLTNIFIDKGLENIHQFLTSILLCFSYFIGGIIYKISVMYKKKNITIINESRTNSNSSIKLIYNEGDNIPNKNMTKIWLFLFLMSILVSIFFICGDYFSTHNIFEERFYFFIFIPLFSKIILKEKIYKHQILSLSISFIGFIFILLPVIL